MRTATVHGLRLSMLLVLLVGWVYAEVNRVGGVGGEQCTEIGTALGPTLKQKIRDSMGPRGTTRGQESALSMTVCDPELAAMIPTLAVDLAKTPEFEEVARIFKGAEGDLSTLSLLKSLMSNGGP